MDNEKVKSRSQSEAEKINLHHFAQDEIGFKKETTKNLQKQTGLSLGDTFKLVVPLKYKYFFSHLIRLYIFFWNLNRNLDNF